MDEREQKLFLTTDAVVWAHEFCKEFENKPIDLGTVVSWFANAMEVAKQFARPQSDLLGPKSPPWAEGIGDIPDVKKYAPYEQFIAGALSTMAPFSSYHPAWALPFARRAMEALEQYEPPDAEHWSPEELQDAKQEATNTVKLFGWTENK